MSEQPAKHFITAGNHRVCYVEGGHEGQPRALFLHGWIASHQLYRKVWKELGELFHFVAPDLLGFGDSDKPDPKDAAYDPPFYAESLRQFVDAIGWKEPFVLVAQSMGGLAAVEFALRFPERVSKLILIDSAGIEVPPPVLGKILQLPVIGRPLFMALGGTRKAVSDFLKNDVYFVKEVFDEKVIDDMLRVQRLPGGKAAAYATLIRMVGVQAVRAFAPRFSQLKVPVRLVWGEKDMLYPLDPCARTIEKQVPGAKLIVVPGAGHEPPVERPAEFIAALKEAVQ